MRVKSLDKITCSLYNEKLFTKVHFENSDKDDGDDGDDDDGSSVDNDDGELLTQFQMIYFPCPRVCLILPVLQRSLTMKIYVSTQKSFMDIHSCSWTRRKIIYL